MSSPSETLQNKSSEEIWRSVCQNLRELIQPQKYASWISPLQPLEARKEQNRTHFVIACPSQFEKEWVADNFGQLLESLIGQVTGGAVTLEIQVHNHTIEIPAAVDAYSQSDASPSKTPATSPTKGASTPRAGKKSDPTRASNKESRPHLLLNSKYVFDNFVVGSSNQFAHASARAVADEPGKRYNPLFLYSASGLGKTHLLHAIGNAILLKNPHFRVAYISAENFTNELVDAIRFGKTSEFRTKYRESYDLLLFDDIQFIAKKEKTEEEFFHTFNDLYSSKRQIVLSSDRPPKDIELLEERIRTRFEWGLVADIQPPEIETRIAILKSKAASEDIYLPDEVATFLATHIKSNVRELEGILIKLQAHSSLTGAEISLDMAMNEIKTSLPEEGQQLTVEMIQGAVCKFFNIKVQDLKSPSRSRQYAEPRQIAIYLVRKYSKLGLKEIGRHFGGKDHSTIIHACHKIEASLEEDPDLRKQVEGVQNLL